MGARAARATFRVAAAVAVVAGVLGTTAVPALAGPVPVSPALNCIVLGSNGTFQAVFDYHAKNNVTIPVGPNNNLDPPTLNGNQPTDFTFGWNRAAFATAPVSGTTVVTWTVDGISASADSTSGACGPNVSLPSEGNGIGPVIVIVLSVLLSMLAVAWRRRRARRRGADA